MAFCIDCGAKAPDLAKFCPQCGSALVTSETTSAPASDNRATENVTPTVETETPDKTNKIDRPDETSSTTSEIDTGLDKADSVDSAPSAAASLAAAANDVEDEPKSKVGLFVGLSLLALIAAGGGSYATGLFDSADSPEKGGAVSAETSAAVNPPKTDVTKIETPEKDPVLTAYQEAIKTGRISDLGAFARNNADNSLAKDAEAAAFASLNRQGSVLAYNTFVEYFPDADVSAYTGLRATGDESIVSGDAVIVELDEAATNAPLIRTSITERASELDPFIKQGDIAYVVSVIDEMLGVPGLTDAEATFLLNLRARAETSAADAVPNEVEFVVPDPVVPNPVVPDPVVPNPVVPNPIAPDTVVLDATPAEAFETVTPPVLETQACWDGSIIELSAACPAMPAEETSDSLPASEAGASEPTLAYDTAAKPIERPGGITPETATEPGECDMFFDVTISGSPTNIDASCSNSIFVDAAKEAVANWVYSPALLGGEPVRQNDIVVKIRFNLE